MGYHGTLGPAGSYRPGLKKTTRLYLSGCFARLSVPFRPLNLCRVPWSSQVSVVDP